MLAVSSSSSSSTPTPHPEPKKPKSEAEAEEAANKLIPSLPDDVALNCLARVPASYHRTLSQVSKPIQSLLSSPLFFNTRSLLHTTEPLLYLTTCSFRSSLQWFTLYRNPNNANVVVPVPVPSIPCLSELNLMMAAYAVVGPNIYVIGGFICSIPSQQVWVLDCRFNRWQPGPTMLVGRQFPTASVVDGKIYVMGGYKAGATIWAEVLDPAIGRWVEVPLPTSFEVWKRKKWAGSIVVDDKVCVFVDGALLVYDTRSRVWESVETELLRLGRSRRVCVVDGVLYSCGVMDKIMGIDVRQIRQGGGVWKELKGLEQVFPWLWGAVFLTDVGGKLLVAWRYPVTLKEESEIWCTEIEVNKNEDAQLWGKVCWSQKVLSVPRNFYITQYSAVVL